MRHYLIASDGSTGRTLGEGDPISLQLSEILYLKIKSVFKIQAVMNERRLNPILGAVARDDSELSAGINKRPGLPRGPGPRALSSPTVSGKELISRLKVGRR